MKLKTLVASIALSLMGMSAMAAGPSCTRTTGWGSLGPPGLEVFGNSFSSANSYTDCYTFALSGNANSLGGAIGVNALLSTLNIDIQAVSLYLGNTLLGSDTSPLNFSFGSLSGGVGYTLAILSNVTKGPGPWTLPVGYGGTMATIAAPVPEPDAVALVLAGLLGVGASVWRRKKT